MNESDSTTPTTTAQKVVVAMSGGVDSSVVAALLKERGFDIIGVTLQLQPSEQPTDGQLCCGLNGPARAQAVAEVLQIPHQVIPCEREFIESVLKPAWEEYASGRTPSPCLWCNERVKFGVLVDWAKSMGAVAVATGHYARIIDDAAGNPTLVRAVDRNKDQSYFLARLTTTQLKQAMFPLGNLLKQDVRALARRFGLPTAEQTESQDACLVGTGETFAEKLRQQFSGAARLGPIVDRAGKPVGRHAGIHRFTIGQRRGLCIAATGRSWVKAIEPDSSTVMVTHDERDLFSQTLVTTETYWHGEKPTSWPIACEVQVRYRHAPVPAEVQPLCPGSVRVTLQTPVRAITPGQAAVFYRGDHVIGSGWISAGRETPEERTPSV